MIEEIKGIAALDAEEVAIDPALIAVVATHNVHSCIGAPDAECRFAAITAMRANRANVLHFPRTGLVTIGS